MNLKIAEYNMEWMKYLFVNGIPTNTPPPQNKPESDWNEDEKTTIKSQQLISVLAHLDADIIAVVEGPDTLVNGTKTAKGQLELWMSIFNLTNRNYKVIEGYTSRGQQELCAIYDADKLILEHTPEGNNPFNDVFLADTLEKNIKEQYEHWSPYRIDHKK